MARNEFNDHYLATVDNTDGYSLAALACINEAVYDAVKELDFCGYITKSHVDNMMARELARI